jgi:broad specificity phosphatase PhoE
MLRTVETAQIVAREVGLPVRVRAGCHEHRETVGYRCWGGRELAARYPDLLISTDLDPEDWDYGGESRRAAIDRADSLLSWLADEAATRPEGRVAIVTHGAFTQIVFGRVLRAAFDPMERVVLDNTSVSTLLLSASEVVVLGLNDTSHLAGEADLDPVVGLTR